MARRYGARAMKAKPAPPKGTLIAVDGIAGKKVRTAAKKAVAGVPRRRRGGVSVWDASGVFGDLVVAGEDAGRPSARTLLLLYAADLAFRLRWEIRPAIEEGRTVAAAPYVATAMAFGRAAGLPAGWLKNLFAFAMAPDEIRIVDGPPSRRPDAASFVDFGCERLPSNGYALTRRQLTARARKQLTITSRS